MRHRRTRSPSGLRPLEVEDAMTTLAVYELTALQLLVERGTDSRAARAARLADHCSDGDVLPLFENAEEVVLQAIGQLRFECRGALFQLLHFRSKIAEGMLPFRVRSVPSRFEIGAAFAPVIEIRLQRFDLAHHL